MNKCVSFLVCIVAVTFLTACAAGDEIGPTALQATLDSMVQSTLVILEKTSTKEATATHTPAPTKTPLPDTPTTTPTLSLFEELPTEQSDKVLPTATLGNVLACLNSLKAVNVRELPSPNALRVDVVQITECVELLELSENRQWGRTEKGWVFLEYLNIAGKIDHLPVFEETSP